MPIHDLIIVGSGCSGAWAAYQAVQRGFKPLVLDVGIKPGPEPVLSKNIFELREKDENQRQYLLGPQYESLHNLHHSYMTSKLKAPRFRYVIDRTTELAPLNKQGFDPVQSFALGGLANAWGGGVYRYLDKDLKQFPFKGKDLEPYFDILTREVGVSGAVDDMAGHLGPGTGLQKPLRLDTLSAHLLQKYQAKKSCFRRNGFTLGHSRVCLLSEPLPDRPACNYDNLTFWQADLPYIYSPAMTMKKLIADKKIEYADQCLVEKFEDTDDGVAVSVKNLRKGTEERFEAKKLILGAGTLNSARIVLQSYNDFKTHLPLLENQISLIPFLHPRFLGYPIEEQSTGLVQLNAVYEGPLWDSYVQASYFGISSPLASDIFRDLPLAGRGNLMASKYVLPAISVLQLFYQDEPNPDNYLKLEPNGALSVFYSRPPQVGKVEEHLIKLFRKAGFLSHSSLVQYPSPGNGIHYAGTLAMSNDPNLIYRTEADGKLACTKNVYVADAGVFPVLPAKNLSFAIMAIAMRIADQAVKGLRTKQSGI